MDKKFSVLPCISINPQSICTYSEIIWDGPRPARKKLSLPLESYLGALSISIDGKKDPADKFLNSSRSAEGKISKVAKRKMGKALDYLLLMSQDKTVTIPRSGKKFAFKIAFVTFDLPSEQIHTDNEIKEKLWNSMLIELTRYHQVKHYLWRAEKQKNGNIHFHLIIDKFVPYDVLRRRWNRITNKLGYVDRYRDNQLKWHSGGFTPRPELFKRYDNKTHRYVDNWTLEKQRKAYEEGMAHNWSSPNSTDIHSIRNILNLRAYVAKYVTKPAPGTEEKSPEHQMQLALLSAQEREEIQRKERELFENFKVQGRIWGCNQDLSDIKGAQEYIDSQIEQALKQTVAATKCHSYSGDYFTVYYIDTAQLQKHSPDVLFQYFASYLLKKFNFSAQLSL